MNQSAISRLFLVITFLFSMLSIDAFAQVYEFPQRSNSSYLWWESSKSYTFSDGIKDTSNAEIFYRWKERTEKPDGFLEYRSIIGSSQAQPYSLRLQTDLEGGFEQNYYSPFDAISSKWKNSQYSRQTEVVVAAGESTIINVSKTRDNQNAVTQQDSSIRQTKSKLWEFYEKYEDNPFSLTERTRSTYLNSSTTISESFVDIDGELVKTDSTVNSFDSQDRILNSNRYRFDVEPILYNLTEFSYFADTTILKQSFYERQTESLLLSLLQRSWETTSGDTLIKSTQIINIDLLPDTVAVYQIVEKSLELANKTLVVGNEYYVFDADGNISMSQISSSTVDENGRVIAVTSRERNISGQLFQNFTQTRTFHTSGILLHEESHNYALENGESVLNQSTIYSNRLDESSSIIDSAWTIRFFKSSGWDSTLTVYSLTDTRPTDLDNPGELITSIKPEIPESFHVFGNYPNPFNPTTTLSYQLPFYGYIEVDLFNTLGQKVHTLLQETQSSGTHQLQIDGSRLSSGVYFYRIRFENQIKTGKITLQK